MLAMSETTAVKGKRTTKTLIIIFEYTLFWMKGKVKFSHLFKDFPKKEKLYVVVMASSPLTT